eukprot:GGOE01002528.1.p1 GENE.GGOE01002528.1~~GGOE01002528.1.p1  ORF type:complete len:628 (+),score=97.90 GGOE01002528.1:81-1964(+)
MSRKASRIQEFMGNQGTVNCAKFGRTTGQLIATGGQDRKVNIWKVGCPSVVAQLHGHTSTIESVTFDYEEELVVSGSSGGTIKVWDLNSERMQKSFNYGHKTNVTCLDYHPFGNFFCSGSADTQVKVWDLRKKSYLQTYKGHTKQVNTLKFSPDGRWVVSGGGDGVVKLWDLTAGKQMEDFTRHSAEITCLDFHPSEFLLAVSSADRTITFWDLDKFKQVSQSPLDSKPIRSIRFTPEGKALCSLSSESLKVWGWEPITCYDGMDLQLQTVGDMHISERTGELFGISYVDSFVSVWNVRLRQMLPFGEVAVSKDGPTGGKHPLQPRPPSQPLQSPTAVQKLDHHREYLVNAETKAQRIQEVFQNVDEIQKRFGLLDTAEQPSRQADQKKFLRKSQELPAGEARGGYQVQAPPSAAFVDSRSSAIAAKGLDPSAFEGEKLGNGPPRMAMPTAAVPDSVSVERLLGAHQSFYQVLTHRLANMKLLRSMWMQDRRGALQHVQQLNDISISVDFIKQAVRKERDLTLDLSIAVLPVIRHVFASPLEPYLIAALEATSTVWHAFGELILKTLATKSYVVDVMLEERKDKCRIAMSILGEIRLEVQMLKDRKDDVGQRSRLLWKELPDELLDC